MDDHKDKAPDDPRYPMTPEQAKALLENQEKLMKQMATMRYHKQKKTAQFSQGGYSSSE